MQTPTREQAGFHERDQRPYGRSAYLGPFNSCHFNTRDTGTGSLVGLVATDAAGGAAVIATFGGGAWTLTAEGAAGRPEAIGVRFATVGFLALPPEDTKGSEEGYKR